MVVKTKERTPMATVLFRRLIICPVRPHGFMFPINEVSQRPCDTHKGKRLWGEKEDVGLNMLILSTTIKFSKYDIII